MVRNAIAIAICLGTWFFGILLCEAVADKKIGIISIDQPEQYANNLTQYLNSNASPVGDRYQWISKVIPFCDPSQLYASVENMIVEDVDALLVFGFCRDGLLAIDRVLGDSDVVVIEWSDAGSRSVPLAGRKLTFEFPSVDTRAFTDRFASKPSHLAGWCDDGFDSYDTDRFGPFVMCVERGSPDSEASALEAVAITSLQVLLSHPDLGGAARTDGTPVDVATKLGSLSIDWNAGQVNVPTGVMLDRDHPDIQQALGQGPITDTEELVHAICPNCTATGDICGSSCPQECGTKTCTRKGEKQCCSSDGMPLPQFSSAR